MGSLETHRAQVSQICSLAFWMKAHMPRAVSAPRAHLAPSKDPRQARLGSHFLLVPVTGSHPVFYGFVSDPSIHVHVHDSGHTGLRSLFPGTRPAPSARLVLSVHSDVNFCDVGHTGLKQHTGLLYSSPPCYSTFSFTVFICRPGSQRAPNSGIKKWMGLLAIR